MAKGELLVWQSSFLIEVVLSVVVSNDRNPGSDFQAVYECHSSGGEDRVRMSCEEEGKNKGGESGRARARVVSKG